MMKKLTTTFILIFSVAFFSSGKEKTQVQYAVGDISPALKKDAYAICRKYSHEFELIDYGKAIEKVHMVITVLEENGDHFSKLFLPYDKTQKVKSITGRSYDQLGLPDDKLKNSAIQDVNYTTAGAIYDDLRLKLAEFKTENYPYTIEYEFEIEHEGLISYPEWKPLQNYRISVEESSFRVIFPEKLEIRYRESNLPSGCKKEKIESGKHIFEWQLDSLTAWKDEPLSPGLGSLTPGVQLGPTTFIFDGSTGRMNSWKELGNWAAALNDGMDQLPDARKAEIRKMIGEVTDTVLAVQILYKYMQKRTRYVAIQLGLGSFKPFPAETTDRLGYGDCKALSNYMKALLNCVGIPSYYTLAGAGPNRGITWADFPTIAQNNHVIVCVPLKKDTLWLECTSQTQPCGYLGKFVEGRKVLLVTSDGGKIVKTPQLNSQNNLQFRSAEVQINPDGAMQSTVKTRFTGYQYDNVSSLFEESQEDQKKELLDNMGIPGLIINSFGYDVKKEKIPEATESLAISSTRYATKTGARLFIPLNMLNQRKSFPSKVEERKMPVVQSYSYHDKDSIVFELPKEYQLESAPKGKTLSTEYGVYNSSITFKDDKAIYIREVKINRGTWPKENYQALVDFYSAIVSADKAKLVLKEKLKDLN
jgi:hypothetical protein